MRGRLPLYLMQSCCCCAVARYLAHTCCLFSAAHPLLIPVPHLAALLCAHPVCRPCCLAHQLQLHTMLLLVCRAQWCTPTVTPIPASHSCLCSAPLTLAAPRIKQVVQRTLDLPEQPPIAQQGQAFAREQLTMEALHCYWLGALQRYADIYYLPRTPAQEAASSGGGSSKAVV